MTLHTDATALPRLMVCGASKTMPGFTVQTDVTDDVREGNAAHWLASEYLNQRISDLDEWADRKAPNGVYMSVDLIDHVRWYVDGVKRTTPTNRFVEAPMKAWNNDKSITVGCRADHLADYVGQYSRRIHVDDLKMGFRIVEPEMNWTLLAHSFAYMADKVVDPSDMFEFTIWQPRPYHRSGPRRIWIIDAFEWSRLRNVMFETLATNSDTLVTGPYCYRCPARSNCPALRQASMTVLDVIDHGVPDEMTVDDMSLMMDVLTSGEHLLGQYKEALGERIAHAIQSGQSVRNYRIEPTTGSLAWNDGVTADWLQLLTTETVAKPAPLKTPTQLKRYIPPAVMDTLTHRKPGGHKLVRRDAQQLAQEMFGGLQT